MRLLRSRGFGMVRRSGSHRRMCHHSADIYRLDDWRTGKNAPRRGCNAAKPSDVSMYPFVQTTQGNLDARTHLGLIVYALPAQHHAAFYIAVGLLRSA